MVLDSGGGISRNTDLLGVAQAVGPTWLTGTVTGGKQTRLQFSQKGDPRYAGGALVP